VKKTPEQVAKLALDRLVSVAALLRARADEVEALARTLRGEQVDGDEVDEVGDRAADYRATRRRLDKASTAAE